MGDEPLVEAVRKGRREEFASFAWKGEVPDPQAEETFERSKLRRASDGRHGLLKEFYRELIRIRKAHPHFRWAERSNMDVEAMRDLLQVRYSLPGEPDLLLLIRFGKETAPTEAPDGNWRVLVDSTDERWILAGDAQTGRFVRLYECGG